MPTPTSRRRVDIDGPAGSLLRRLRNRTWGGVGIHAFFMVYMTGIWRGSHVHPVTKPFNLLRWFSLLSLLCISALSFASASLLSRFLTENMLWRDAVVTMQFVQSTIKTMNPSAYFGEPQMAYSQATHAEFFAQRNRTQAATAFEDFFARLAHMPEVVRANVYAQDMTLIWSANQDLIGIRSLSNDELRQALTGELVVSTSGLIRGLTKTEHAGFDRGLETFAEIYLPIWNTPHDAIIGAVEVYKAPDVLFAAITQGQRLIWTSAVGGGLFLYLVLFWVVRRGALVIHQQREQLVAAETMAAVGEMSSAIAHNIRNPLASIRSSAEVALEEEDTLTLHQHAEDVISEVDRLEHWLRQLLTYTRPLDHAPTRVQLSAVLQATLQRFDRNLAKQEIHTCVELAPALPPLQADPPLLQQVLHSVMANALEAMPHGGTLTICAAPVPNRPQVRLQIQDTGYGIPADKLDQAFKPFFTTKRTGLGVGLAFAKRIVERHGGTIDLVSLAGQGTTVSLCLPVAE